MACKALFSPVWPRHAA